MWDVLIVNKNVLMFCMMEFVLNMKYGLWCVRKDIMVDLSEVVLRNYE